MKKLLTLLLSFALLFPSKAQGPYELNWKKEVILFGLSAPLIANMFLADPAKTSLTPEEIATLDPADVNAFDRGATDNWSVRAANLSDIGLISAPVMASGMVFVLPAVNSPKQGYRKEMATLSVMLLETNLLNLGLTELAKTTARRIRPYAYNPEAPMEEKLDSDVRKSFFSGHTSITAANSFFIAKVFADYYPDSKWKPVAWSAAALLSGYTGYMRVKAGKHYASDVITGFAVGAAFGYFIPQMHRILPETDQTSLLITPYLQSGARGLTFLLSLK